MRFSLCLFLAVLLSSSQLECLAFVVRSTHPTRSLWTTASSTTLARTTTRVSSSSDTTPDDSSKTYYSANVGRNSTNTNTTAKTDSNQTLTESIESYVEEASETFQSRAQEVAESVESTTQEFRQEVKSVMSGNNTSNKTKLESADAESVPELPIVTVNQKLAFIQSIGAISGRGEFATPTQKREVKAVVEKLEATNPTNAPMNLTQDLVGVWELLYSSTQLFRSSPFFMAGRAVCETESQAAQFNWFCDMHRKALAISSIKAVRQIVSNTTLVSELEVEVGAIPFLSDFTPFSYSGGWPVTITGALVSSAEWTPANNGTAFSLYMDTVQIKGSNIPVLRNVLDNVVSFQSRTLSKLLEQSPVPYKTPRPTFRTTYLNEQFRINRDQDDNIFVYVKTKSEPTVTDYSKVDADLGVFKLMEGFNDAITRVYL